MVKHVRNTRVNNAGVSLIELVVVVTLVGLMAGFGVPVLASTFSQTTLEAAAEEVATALTYAQFTAVSSGRPCRVTLDAGAETVVLEQEATPVSLLGSESQLADTAVETASLDPMMHPMRPFDDYRLDLGVERRFHDTQIVSVIWDTGVYVEYDASGIPSTGGVIVLANGTDQISVTVEAVSGMVTMN